ncbi:MAG: YjjG family noncanonical pyrimidine nucleotidase [Flavobacteriaceae bacterium]|nr:YjjG family noncanonical pyrimidine nucleotidase [Flavobacteriaceae bacterium]
MDKHLVKHIFFDLDNTLWDHRKNSEETLKKMYAEYDMENSYQIPFDKWHSVFYDKNELLWEMIREGQIPKAELRKRRFRDPFSHFDIQNDALADEWEEIYLTRMGKMNGIVEGAVELLQYLEPKYHLHIITNGFIEVSSAKIENSALNGYFQTLTCADELNLRKPDPRIFHLAMEKSQAKNSESLIIGDDWIADIIGGIGVGWQAIFFDTLRANNQMPKVPNVKKLQEIIPIL